MNRRRALRQLSGIFGGRLPRAPDWASILAMANQELVTSELSRNLQRLGEYDALPVDLRTFLDSVGQRVRERTARLSVTLIDALTVLNRAGMEPVLLKGCAIWAMCGSDAAIDERNRLVADIDLLVRPTEMPAALKALSDAGFAVLEAGRGQYSGVALGRPEDAGAIDLHQRAPGARWIAGLETLHDHSEHIRFRNAMARLPSPTLQILIAVLHDQFQDRNFWHGGFELRHLLDIAFLSRQPNNIDWRWLVQSCSSTVVRAGLIAELVAARELANAEIPGEITKSAWGQVNFARQRAQFLRPALNKVLHYAPLNKFVWNRLSALVGSRGWTGGPPNQPEL